MRKFFAIMLVVSWLLLLPCAAKASVYIEPDPEPPESMEGIYTIDGVIYRITGEDTVEVGYDTPQAVDPMCAAVVIPQAVTIENKEYRVTAISGYAFADCEQLKKVELPEGILSIGTKAFRNCKALKNIDLPITLTEMGRGVFMNTGLERITIPGSIQTVPVDGFQGCESLKTVIMTHGTRSIGIGAFSSCNLEEILWPDTLVTIGSYAFSGGNWGGKLVLPESIRSLADHAFSGSSFREIILPEGLESIGAQAFMNSQVSRVTIPSTVRAIGECAFGSCENLRLLYVPDSVTEITPRVFEGTQLKAIYTGHTQQRWAEITEARKLCEEPVEMIYECDALPDQAQIGEIFGYEDMIYQIVNLPEDQKAGEVRVMQRYLITYEKIMLKIPEWVSYKGEQYQVTSVGKNLLNSGQQVLLPDSIRILDQYALAYGDFSDFDFPESLEVIGEGALVGSGFTRINLPSGLRVIGDYAFDIPKTGTGNAEAHIEELVIPEGVESIGEQAFAYSFSKISLPGSLTYLGERAFTARNLKEIVLSGENASLYLEEGVLFQRTSTDTILVLYPSQREGSEYTVPEGVTAIAPYAFESCNLEKVILPQSMTVIGDEAFSHSGLEQIVLPDGITRIGDEAFSHSGLKQIVLPDGITRIGDEAFSHSGLEQIVLPDGITQIGKSAFALCENLCEIYIPASVESIGKAALYETHDFLCLRTGHSREGWESILKKTSRRDIGYSGMAFLVGEPFWFVWEPIGLCLFGIGSCLVLVVSGIQMKKRKKFMEEPSRD